jgi:DUF917 family protein
MRQQQRKELQERAAYLLPFVQAAAEGRQVVEAAVDTIAFPISGMTWYADHRYKILEEDGE